MSRTAVTIAAGVALTLAAAAALTIRFLPRDQKPTVTAVTTSSKNFPESVVLGEALAVLAQAGLPTTLNDGKRPVVEHKAGLGGTQVVFQALLKGDVDAYVDYTGTLFRETFADQGLSNLDDLRAHLRPMGVGVSAPIGFNNSYGIALREPLAEKLGLTKISDLRAHPDLRPAFNHEFLSRSDGWQALKRAYNLPQQTPRGIDHALGYAAIEAGQIDLKEVYTTDAQILTLNLRVLEDDRSFFPPYDAVILYRLELAESFPDALESMLRLEGAIDEKRMRTLNQRALDPSRDAATRERRAGREFVEETFGVRAQQRLARRAQRITRATAEHLVLVAVSAGAAILVSIPLGVLAARVRWLTQPVLGITGILQTIPSIAMLVFMIPLFGTGARPAIAALFLYSLLPIVRNTCAGLNQVPAELIESAAALGLRNRERLWLVELPIASSTILAGVKTAVVINVGTAALGGFIGAGGYGEAIFAGLRQSDTALILEGAIPAALMAVAAQVLFELIERTLVPKGLRLRSETN